MVEALCLDRYLIAVAGHQSASKILLGDIAYDLHTLHFFDFFVVGERHGEQKFIVLAAVHGCGHKVHAQFFCHDCCLIIDGYAVLIHATSRVACLADVEKFARQSVRHIHHRRGLYSVVGKHLHYVLACFRLQLTLHKILLSFKFRLEILHAHRCRLLAFKQLKSHIGSSEVAAHAYQVSVLGAVAIHNLVLWRSAYAGD